MSLNKGGEYVPEIKSKNTRCTWKIDPIKKRGYHIY